MRSISQATLAAIQGKQKDHPTYGSRARDPAIPIVQPITVGGYDVYSRMLFQLS